MNMSTMSIVYHNEWERLRGLGGEKKMALEKNEFLALTDRQQQQWTAGTRGVLRGPRGPKKESPVGLVPNKTT